MSRTNPNSRTAVAYARAWEGVSAAELLVAEGHNGGGRCEKCWARAASMYANGQGPYESHTSAYYAAMNEAEKDARRRADPSATSEDGA